MSEFFSAHGYPTSVTENALGCAKQISRACALNPAAPVTNERPIISVLYHPHNLPVCQILRPNWHILQNSTTVGTIFCDRPLVDLKKDRNLGEILVHSNFHSQANSTPGTFPCSIDRCKTGPHLCTDTSIRGPNGHMSIKRTFTCHSDNLVYAITCQSCNLIYVGETSRSLTVRFSEHLADIRHNCSKPNTLTLLVLPLQTSKWKAYGNCIETPFNENTRSLTSSRDWAPCPLVD